MKKVFCNWKMYLSSEEAVALSAEIAENHGNKGDAIAVFPSAEVLDQVYQIIESTDVVLGAQNCHWEGVGAHTGELSADNLKELGCHYVLVGHSERRAMGETDEQINLKIKSSRASGLVPVLCVGELEKDRADGKQEEVVNAQLEAGLRDVEGGSFIVAYEPVWAIGTGNPATPEDAEKMCAYIKEKIADKEIEVLYGGSVNPDDVKKYRDLENVDGFLIGGASTKAQTLFPIIETLE